MTVLLFILSRILTPKPDQEIFCALFSLFALILGLTYDIIFIINLIRGA